MLKEVLYATGIVIAVNIISFLIATALIKEEKKHEK